MTASRSLTRYAALLLISTLAAATAMAFPTSRTATRMVYADHLQRVVLFGGVTDPDASSIRYFLDDTWEWSGQRWIQIITEQKPSPRSSIGMAYDSNRKQVILFGGVTYDTEFLGDTWAYRDRNWVQLDPPSSPSPRMFPAMTFDPLRDRVILFGGIDSSGSGSAPLSDTWEFDGTTWTRVDQNGPTLLGANIVYDHKRRETLLLGLNDSTDQSEMYVWRDNSWQTVNTSTLPQCVNLSGLVYQSHNEKVLSVGGQCANGGIEDESWEWDGANWFEVKPAATQGGVVAFGLAYDPLRSHTILFGGDSFGTSAATYIFSGGVWRPLFDQSSPGPRSLHVFEYDPVRNVHWLFGGRAANGDASDLWMHSGTSWSNVRAENTPSCGTPAGDWDSDRNRLVVVCTDSSVFEWDGETWTVPTLSGDKPEERRWGSLVYDPKTKTSIYFGGYSFQNLYLRDTWSWNGTRWTRLGKDKTAPPARALTSMFYDPKTQRITLFGGIGRNNATASISRYGDMWSFDGTSWAELKSVPTKPGPRYGAKAELNPQTQTVMLFGGKSDQERYLNDQWEWDGTTWRKVELNVAPTDRMNYGLLFDSFLQRFVLYGGYAGQYFAELWTLSGDTWIPEQAPFAGRRRAASIAPPAGTSASVPELSEDGENGPSAAERGAVHPRLELPEQKSIW